MSIDKAKLELLLLNQAHEWLEHFDKIDLHLSSQLLIPQMQQALSRGDHAEVRSFIERLIDLSDKIQNNSSAEELEPSIIRIECALAAYRMKNYNEAITLLEKAIQVDRGAKERHLEGTIKFMLGCIQWQLSNQGDNAIISWENTIKIYRELEKINSDTHVITRSTWYSVRLAEIKTVLEGALEPSEPPHKQSNAKRSQVFRMHDNEDNSDWNSLRLFPVYEQISAGHFGPSGILLEPVSYLETQQILIEDCIHRIHSLLRTERVLNLSSAERFYILKVSGNSMNQSQPVPIEDGDYVLMRQQSTANNGDIVAAEIISGDDRDSRATLKRFMNSNGKIILTPESNDPRYAKPLSPPSHFTKFDDGFRICGVAIAVLKKI